MFLVLSYLFPSVSFLCNPSLLVRYKSSNFLMAGWSSYLRLMTWNSFDKYFRVDIFLLCKMFHYFSTRPRVFLIHQSNQYVSKEAILLIEEIFSYCIDYDFIWIAGIWWHDYWWTFARYRSWCKDIYLLLL